MCEVASLSLSSPSLRSLCRALMYASSNPCGTFKRSLFEVSLVLYIAAICYSPDHSCKTVLSSTIMYCGHRSYIDPAIFKMELC